MAGIVADLELDYTSAIAGAEDYAQALADALDTAAQIGAESIASNIQAALDAISATSITVDADTTPAATEVTDLVATVDSENAAIQVDADTTDAQAAVDDLTSSIDSAGSSASGAQEKVSGLGLSTGQLAGVAGLAVGEVGGLREASSLLGERTAIATTGALGLAAGIGELYHQGIQAVSAEERFNLVLGETAALVESVHVGDLNTDLFTLTQRMGATDAATRNAAATVFQFSLNAGASRQEAAHFTDDLFALASRAVALKPSLGDVTDVAASMEVGLGRARSAAQQYGISISQAEINTRAMEDTGKTSASTLTAYEKSVAGAEIALERYGGTLKSTIDEGSQNAAIEQRRLTASFEDFLASAGKPLVAPALDLIKEAIPVGKDLASALSDIATVAIPLLSGALTILGPAIEPVVVGFFALKAATLAASGIAALAGGLEVLAGEMPAVAIGETTAAAATETLAGSLASLSVGLSTLSSAAIPAAIAGFAAYEAETWLLKTARDAAGGHTLSDTLKEEAAAAREAAKPTGDLVLKFEDVIKAVSTDSGPGGLVLELRAFKDIAEQNIGTAARLADQFPKTSDTYRGMQRILLDLTTAQSQATGGSDALAASTAGQTALNDTAAASLKAYSDGTGTATQALNDEAAAQKETTDALTLYKNELQATQGVQGDVTAGHIALTNANAALFASLLKNGAQFDVNTVAGAANVSALQQSVSAADALAEATFKQTGKQSDADAVMKGFTDTLTANLQNLGLNTFQVLALENQLGLLKSPPPIVVTVDVSQAFGGLDALGFRLGILAKQISDLGYDPGAALGGAHAAAGAYVPAKSGGTVLTVGEAGYDEAVISPRNIPGAIDSLTRLGILDKLQPTVVTNPPSVSAVPRSQGNGPLIGQQTNIFQAPVPSPAVVAREQARASRLAISGARL